MKSRCALLLLLVTTLGTSVLKGAPQITTAVGLGINVPVVGRIIGGGTLFYTSIDITNQMDAATQVDYYFDGSNSRSGEAIVLTGSVGPSGLAQQGSAIMRGHSNVHFDDFVDTLAQSGFITASTRDDGVLGSLLVVFSGANRSGQGSVTARIANSFGGGTVGLSLRGRELTVSEPQALVAAIRDTRGNRTGAAQLYPNLFINNIGVTTNGVDPAGGVVVQVSAVGNANGQAAGTPLRVTIGSGQTVSLSQLLNQLQVPPGTDDTYLVYVKVVSGSAAIQGVVSEVDATTKAGSAFEMSRADF